MKLKFLRTTPLPIWILSTIFILLPILSYIGTANYYRLPMWNVTGILFSMKPFQILVLAGCILVAFGLLARNIIGYYAFLILSLIFILYNIWLLIQHFILGLKLEVVGLPIQTSDILGNFFLTCFLLVGIFYFLNKEISAPYFSPYSRGWRKDVRETIPIPFSISLPSQSIQGITINISQTGALIPWDDDTVPEEGDEFSIQLEYENMEGEKIQSHLQAIVMRIMREEGFPGKAQVGIRFLKNSDNEVHLENLEYFLKERYAPRYMVQEEVHFGKETYEDNIGTISNVSINGMYIESTFPVKTNDELYIKIPTIPPIRMEGRVSWVNPNGNFRKKPGFGVQIVLNRNPWRFYLWLFKVQLRNFQTR